MEPHDHCQSWCSTWQARGASPKGETAARDLLALDRDPSATPEGARRLLAEAGYPSGFGITLQAANHRYV
jgi:hypothetical protein